MYNAELKHKFLKEYSANRSLKTIEFTTAVFNATSKYEEKFGQDICTMKHNMLEPIVEDLVGIRVRGQWARISVLKDYVKWCIASGYPGACDDMLNVEIVGLDKVRSRMVANPIHLQKYLNDLFDAESEETIDTVYRCFFWMAYMGINEEDIFRVKNSDVDLVERVIRYDGREYEMYNLSVPALKNASQLSCFKYKNPNYEKKVIIRERVPGDTVMRGIRNNPSILTVRSEVSRRSKKLLQQGKNEMRLSYHRVRLSGLFYRMYERELAGDIVDFGEAALEFMSDKTYVLSGTNTLESKKNQVASDYLQDYYRWKAAFL